MTYRNYFRGIELKPLLWQVASYMHMSIKAACSPLEGAKKKGCCQYIGIDPNAAAPLPTPLLLLQNCEDS